MRQTRFNQLIMMKMKQS